MIFDVSKCEEILGYEFKNKMLLRQCFTHSSYANEHSEDDNEVLEFFGDAIIEFIVTEYLFTNSYGSEGELTKRRADMVSKKPLGDAVERLNLKEYMLLGNGQEKSSKQDEKLYSSLYEAVTAGIYLDGGIKEAKKFVLKTLIKPLTETAKVKKEKVKCEADYKSALQEFIQKEKIGSVAYELLNKKGPEHSPTFRSAVIFNGKSIAEGTGHSKKQAEMEAAKKALSKLQKSKTKSKK